MATDFELVLSALDTQSQYLDGGTAVGFVVNDGGYLQEGSESFANIANIINYGEPLKTNGR